MLVGFSFSSFVVIVAIYFRVQVQDQWEQKLSNITVPLKKLVHLLIRGKCWDLIIYRNTVL